MAAIKGDKTIVKTDANGVQHNEKGYFVGSGNPAGRSKSRRAHEQHVRELMAEVWDDDVIRAALRGIADAAKNGNLAAQQYIADQTAGKAGQALDVATDAPDVVDVAWPTYIPTPLAESVSPDESAAVLVLDKTELRP